MFDPYIYIFYFQHNHGEPYPGLYAKSNDAEATAKLVIKDFVELMKACTPGRSYSSVTFRLGDTPMNVEVFPNGHSTKGYVQFGLNNQGDDAITVKGKISTDVHSPDFKSTVLPENDGTVISGVYLKHDQCLNEYKDKDFVLTVDMVGLGDWEIVGKKTSEGPKALSVWEKVYTNMEKPDFTFVFDSQEVPCHKLVLAAASPVLRAMVENKHREAMESKANIELSEEIGQAFVRFIYTGKLEESLLQDQAAAFLELGEMWDLQ